MGRDGTGPAVISSGLKLAGVGSCMLHRGAVDSGHRCNEGTLQKRKREEISCKRCGHKKKNNNGGLLQEKARC